MAKINSYITFNGNCEEAFDFYKSVFGGDFTYIGRFKDMPPLEGKSPPPGEAEKIMHVSLPISNETMLMGCDNLDFAGEATIIGNNFTISISADSNAEADKLFNGLSAGGKVTMPMQETFWSPYFGMFKDKFGIQWMVGV